MSSEPLLSSIIPFAGSGYELPGPGRYIDNRMETNMLKKHCCSCDNWDDIFVVASLKGGKDDD